MAKSAIVTGYSSGLGAAFARQLLDDGWHVVGVSRNGHDESQFRGDEALTAVRGSVDVQSTADRAFQLAADNGDLKLVINCAGQGVFGEIGSYSADDIASVVAGNLVGLILFSDIAVRHMRESGGDIVNVMSTAAKKLRTAESAYVAAKWGAKAYTRTLRDAVKSSKLPIRVFEVYPCGMNTPFWAAATRPPADGSAFPLPGPFATQVLEELRTSRSIYCQEFTFERS